MVGVSEVALEVVREAVWVVRELAQVVVKELVEEIVWGDVLEVAMVHVLVPVG